MKKFENIDMRVGLIIALITIAIVSWVVAI